MARAVQTTSRNVEVLLVHDVDNLGQRGEIVRVKPGYARNYLLPQGKATVATLHNKRMVEKHKERLAAIEVGRVKQLQRLQMLSANTVQRSKRMRLLTIILYGSVVARDISEALKAAGHPVEAEHVRLDGPIKELGMYTVKLKFHEKVQSEVKVWVVPSATSG